MTNPDWGKKKTDEPIYTGIRGEEFEEIGEFPPETQFKIETILEAMDWQQLIVFRYGESDRVVAPFVVGMSSDLNPLMRGYQLEGISRSGKGAGWRVYQINKMEGLENHQDFFNPDEFDFDEYYPWTYWTIATLESSI